MSDTWTPSARQRERDAYRRRRTRRSVLLAVASSLILAATLVIVVTAAPGWPRFRSTFLDVHVAWQALPDLVKGLWLNIRVWAASAIGMLVLGMILAVLRSLRGPVFWPVRALATGYVDLFRGMPVIITLYLIGFGLPALRLQGVPTNSAVLGAIALTLTYAAYVAEVLRAGIESVHPSQRAAARSLGLSWSQTLRHVVLPQAIRRVIPPLMNDLVSLQKDAGLISILGIPLDVLRYAQIWQSQTFSYTPYVVAGLLFILLTIPTTRLADAVSRRYGYTGGSGAHL